MNKQTKTLLVLGAVAVALYFILKPKGSNVQTITTNGEVKGKYMFTQDAEISANIGENSPTASGGSSGRGMKLFSFKKGDVINIKNDRVANVECDYGMCAYLYAYIKVVDEVPICTDCPQQYKDEVFTIVVPMNILKKVDDNTAETIPLVLNPIEEVY